MDERPNPVAAEAAIRRAIELDGKDPWSRKELANALHARGASAEATALYRELVDELRPRRREDPSLTGLYGWCAFRVGDLGAAASSYYEVCSGSDGYTSERFDLALVLLCDGRAVRALPMYETLLRTPTDHVQLRRGYFRVARVDFRQALVDHPGVAELSQARRIESLLDEAIAQLPPLPEVRALSAAAE
jgi:tetratricopeptide (TPR) repeat protein